MSAYIVNTDLIDLLVTAGLRGNGDEARLRVFHDGDVKTFNRYEDADTVGEILIQANITSVNHRYNENTRTESAYRYNGAGITEYLGGSVIPWGHVLGALRCFEYQACETVTWHTSLAKEIIDAIRLKVCRIITDEAGGMWEWSRDDAQEIMEDIKQKVRS